MQKGVFGRAYLSKQKHLEDAAVFEDSDEEKDGRGRSQITTGEAEIGRRGSAINSRIDVIKRIDARREESPTRSIRFADETGDEEHKSETLTPQTAILQDPSVLSHSPFSLPSMPLTALLIFIIAHHTGSIVAWSS
jgi:hypothetical protein